MANLTTDRLTLRPFQAGDAALKHRLIGDLRVFFWRTEPGTLEEAEEWVARDIDRQTAKGLGSWAVFEKSNGDFVGQVILQELPETGEPEIGYHFVPEAQGHGYATEAALELLRHGFIGLNLPRIVAVVLPDNLPSQKVMKKLGLRYEKDIMKADMRHNYFAFERDDYIQSTAPSSLSSSRS